MPLDAAPEHDESISFVVGFSNEPREKSPNRLTDNYNQAPASLGRAPEMLHSINRNADDDGDESRVDINRVEDGEHQQTDKQQHRQTLRPHRGK